MPVFHTRHKSSQVILLVDIINHFEFPGGDRLLKHSMSIAPAIARLKQRARQLNIPVVYVNDNFSQWRSDASKILKYCLREEAIGRDFVKQIAPDDEDYFVLKPMHSGFYQTALELLLRYFGASSLIICGISTNSCVVYTAHDAKMRNFEVIVASDCCAAQTLTDHRRALEHLTTAVGARVVKAASVRLRRR